MRGCAGACHRQVRRRTRSTCGSETTSRRRGSTRTRTRICTRSSAARSTSRCSRPATTRGCTRKSSPPAFGSATPPQQRLARARGACFASLATTRPKLCPGSRYGGRAIVGRGSPERRARFRYLPPPPSALTTPYRVSSRLVRLAAAKVDPDHPDLSRFPKFAHALPLHVTVRAGETLYLPALFYHHVHQSDDSLGRCVAVNMYARVRAWRPVPRRPRLTVARHGSGAGPPSGAH